MHALKLQIEEGIALSTDRNFDKPGRQKAAIATSHLIWPAAANPDCRPPALGPDTAASTYNNHIHFFTSAETSYNFIAVVCSQYPRGLHCDSGKDVETRSKDLIYFKGLNTSHWGLAKKYRRE